MPNWYMPNWYIRHARSRPSMCSCERPERALAHEPPNTSKARHGKAKQAMRGKKKKKANPELFVLLFAFVAFAFLAVGEIENERQNEPRKISRPRTIRKTESKLKSPGLGKEISIVAQDSNALARRRGDAGRVAEHRSKHCRADRESKPPGILGGCSLADRIRAT